MHRSPAGRVFTWTIAGQGPVIVGVSWLPNAATRGIDSDRRTE